MCCVALHQPQIELMEKMWAAIQTVLSEHGGPHARADIERGKVSKQATWLSVCV